MLRPRLLRELTLASTTHPQQRLWLSAASGLVCHKEWAYVVADDEYHLGCFRLDPAQLPQVDQSPLELLTLIEGELPVPHKQRKKAKADLESLVLLPASAGLPNGALLSLGSGSRPNRCRAQLLPLHANGHVDESALSRHDLTDLYEPLRKHFEDLNIEGAFVAGDELRLLQRGNKGKSPSACISYDCHAVTEWLVHPRKHPPSPHAVLLLDFGSVEGVPLCPTDAAALAGGLWVVSLVAEDTDDSYQDGTCIASAIAIMDADDKVSQLHRLEKSPKVEGIAVLAGNTSPTLLMVTDADDVELAAQLLSVRLPHAE